MNVSYKDLDKLNQINKEIAALAARIYELERESDKIWNKYGNKIVIHRNELY